MDQNFDVQKLDKKVDDILEIVQFIKDNSASKQDVDGLRTEMKEEFKNVRTEMKEEFKNVRTEMQQGFSDVKIELANINSELEEIKRDLRKLESRTQIDDDVMIVDNSKLSERVKKLEKQVRQLELAHN